MRASTVLWLLSAPAGAGAATLGHGPGGQEPGSGPVVIVFWTVVALLVWGARAVTAVAMLAARSDLARAFLLLLGPVAALVNDVAAIVVGAAGATALATLDLVLVAAATLLMYRPASNGFLAEPLAARGAALRARTEGPPSSGAWRPTNTLAILALTMVFVFPMLGPVFGIAARNQIAHSGEEGSGMAWAGILVGVGLVVVVGALVVTVALVGPGFS